MMAIAGVHDMYLGGLRVAQRSRLPDRICRRGEHVDRARDLDSAHAWGASCVPAGCTAPF